MKAGTLNPYPAHKADAYTSHHPYPKNEVNKFGKTFMPNAFGKSTVQQSVLFNNIIRYFGSPMTSLKRKKETS